MKWILLCLITAFLIQAGYASADQAQILKGNELDRSRIKVGMYAAVSYRSSKHRQKSAKGYIRATDGSSLAIPIEQLRLGFSPERHGGFMLSASVAF